MSKYIPLSVSLVLAYTAGFIGSVFTGQAIETWYVTLAKPYLNPPNWVFGPVWTTLYALMAIAAYRVYLRRAENRLAQKSLVLYAVHLFINALWSIVFFGMHNPVLAFAFILLLLGTVFALTLIFARIDRTAGLLFVPYLLWVSFATYLNLMIVILN